MDDKSPAYKRWLYRKNQHPRKVKHAEYYADEDDELQIVREYKDDSSIRNINNSDTGTTSSTTTGSRFSLRELIARLL